MKTRDEKYMKMCFTLANKGKGTVSPNPLVGCVVLDKNGKVVSKGYHKKYGENHAERDALSKLKNNEAEGGTLYVNLEPCSHYGHTPPCTDLIIDNDDSSGYNDPADDNGEGEIIWVDPRKKNNEGQQDEDKGE